MSSVLSQELETDCTRNSASQCKCVEIFFFWNRISLDLRSSLTVITEMFLTLKVKGIELCIRLCNSTSGKSIEYK